jgi:hypothetical protein
MSSHFQVKRSNRYTLKDAAKLNEIIIPIIMGGCEINVKKSIKGNMKSKVEPEMKVENKKERTSDKEHCSDEDTQRSKDISDKSKEGSPKFEKKKEGSQKSDKSSESSFKTDELDKDSSPKSNKSEKDSSQKPKKSLDEDIESEEEKMMDEQEEMKVIKYEKKDKIKPLSAKPISKSKPSSPTTSDSDADSPTKSSNSQPSPPLPPSIPHHLHKLYLTSLFLSKHSWTTRALNALITSSLSLPHTSPIPPLRFLSSLSAHLHLSPSQLVKYSSKNNKLLLASIFLVHPDPRPFAHLLDIDDFYQWVLMPSLPAILSKSDFLSTYFADPPSQSVCTLQRLKDSLLPLLDVFYAEVVGGEYE